MRVNSVEIHNFLCHRRFNESLAPESHLFLICGPNGAGKSALLDAIRWTLGDDMPRDVTKKADLDHLLLRGEKDGHIIVDVTEDGKPSRFKLSLRTGNYAGDSPTKLTAAERSALTPHAYLTSDLSARRSMLYALGGIKIGLAQVRADLEGDGHAPTRVARLEDSLRRGFGDASKRAAELASEARGAWKAMTGDTYGDVKAASWRAYNPDPPERGSEAIAAELVKLKASRETARNLLADLDARKRQASAAEEMRTAAADFDALTETVGACEKRIEALVALEASQRAAAANAGGWTAPCPCCGVVLESSRAGDLHQYEAPVVAPPKAAQEAQETANKLATERTVLAKAQRALAHAAACREALKNIPAMPAPNEVTEAVADVDGLNRKVANAESDLQEAEGIERARAAADETTAKALQYHTDVAAYSKLAKDVEALPARYLDAALKKVNAKLGELTPAFGGTPVVIGDDLVPAFGLTAYPLLSESEKWRVELAIGYALASTTHGLCLIDRLDVLQPSARGPVLQFMATQKEVQFIVAATLKDAPSFPPAANIQVRWMGPTPEKK